MRYLKLMLETALANDGQIKATAKGNLPAALVKQASAFYNFLDLSWLTPGGLLTASGLRPR